ncbi:MAG: undecaprenyl-diphosphatase UppP [bacterium]|nr:undecaprenyl-diphosphatase UppP [bacterium]
MTLFQVIVLAVIQGVTEFLPISSSAHLVFMPKLLGFTEPTVTFDVLLHLGTLISILIYFRKEIIKILLGLARQEKQAFQILLFIIIATLPAIFFGVLFEDKVDQAFGSVKAVGVFLLITAILLLSTKLIKSEGKKIDQLTWKNALFVGVLQAVAILPGVSRSGSTITAGLWQKLDRETAFRFSFFLGIPAIFGAAVLKMKDLSTLTRGGLTEELVGLIIASVVGYFSLKVLESVLKSAKLYWFGFYCLILGLLLLVF